MLHTILFIFMFMFVALFRLAQIFTSPSRFKKAAQSLESTFEPIIYRSASFLQGTHQKLSQCIRFTYTATEDLLCSFIPWMFLISSIALLRFVLVSSIVFAQLAGLSIISGLHFVSFWPWWYFNTLFGNGGRSIKEILRNPTCKDMHGTVHSFKEEEPWFRFRKWIHSKVPFIPAPHFDILDSVEILQHDPHGNLLEQKRRSNLALSRTYYQHCYEKWKHRREAFLRLFNSERLESFIPKLDSFIPSKPKFLESLSEESMKHLDQ